MGLSDEHLVRLRGLTPEQRERLRGRLAARRHTGLALVAEGLKKCGIRHLSGITGTPIDVIFREAARRGIRPLGTRHQATAALMAASENYLCGHLRHAVLVSAGPGVTNAMTGLLYARDNHWPLLVMGGRRSLANAGAGYFQELDAVPMMTPIAKWAATVSRAADIVPVIREACQVAIDGQPGPVYLDLPEDVLLDEAEPVDVAPPRRRPDPAAREDEVKEALALVRASGRPLLCLGEGVRWSYDPDALGGLVTREGIPFITTPLGRGFLPDDHPLSANRVRRWAQHRADLMLMVGAWFDWRFRLGAELGPGSRVIHVHPDPARLGRNVALALGIRADPGEFLTQLSAASAAGEPAEHRPWVQEVQAEGVAASKSRTAWLWETADPMMPQQLHRELREWLPEDAIVILEGSVNLSFGQLILTAKKPLSWLDPGWNGTIGCGLPLGLGAKLACPGRPVVAVVGDTGFGLCGMDFETAVRLRLPVIVVVANNNGVTGHLRQRLLFSGDHPELFAQFLPDIGYDQIARAFGGHSAWVTRQEEIGPSLDAAVRSGLPSCLNVRVNPTAAQPGIW